MIGMTGLLEIYEGYLNKPSCDALDNIRIGRNGKGYRKLRKEDIPIEWRNYAKKHGIKVKNKTLIIGDELDPIDPNCIPIMGAFYPRNTSGEWCCTPSMAQYVNSGSQTPAQTCFSAGGYGGINIPYMGIALIDANGNLDLLMDTNNIISSATPNWINPVSSSPTTLCGSQQYNGSVYLSFAAMPTTAFNISTAYLLIGTNTLASGGVFSTVIEWTGVNYQPTVNMPLTINIYLTAL
ncbi:MAG: hypothetical protein RXQ99_10610 [Acidianus sp.]|uniref:hypothetical protein n=1 Tax=Acidianus sp. TaxID=1872104 RepID=UPI003978BD05